MADLVAFLEARITEDQAEFGTERAMPHDVNCPVCGEPSSSWSHDLDPFREVMRFSDGHELHGMAVGEFIMSMPLSDTSERWLAECKAKRTIITQYCSVLEKLPHRADSTVYRTAESELFYVLIALAQPYAGHPDFDPTWTTAD